MTDFDADEPVPPAKARGKKRFWTSDRIIGYSGVVLAMTAAFFPWYVFFNGSRSPSEVTASFLARNLPDWAGAGMFRQTTTASVGDPKGVGTDPAAPGYQDIVTGTVPKEKLPGKSEAKDDGSMDQPFPAEPVPFHLLHVAKGKALIEDANGVYLVGPGSVLPDLSKVASVEEQAGQWIIVTDKGDIYDASGKKQ